jgi:probable F420-dependent oxidoreductase
VNIGVFMFITGASIDVAVLARKSEELGFESLWVPEHTSIPVHIDTTWPGSSDGSMPYDYSQMVDPFVALARASAVTTTLKLGTAICLVPQRHPIILAKEIASLDYLSGGRFLFGVGIGWLREETELFGIDFKDRVQYTRESILAMKELWTKNESEYHGKLIDFPPVMCFPKPVQKPHPPIFLGGSAKNVLRRIVAWGDGWIPNRVTPDQVRQGRQELDRLADEAGRDPATLEIIVHGQPPDPALIKEFEAAGASRIILRCTSASEALAIPELEKMANIVLRA